jgi:plasmid stabilization system protein ParE
MRVVIAPEAEAQILIRKRWWRSHRPKSSERFDQELAEAFNQIGQMPKSFPAYSERSGRIVRRCLLRKASCHLYFEVMEAVGEVWIVAAWGAVQGRGPRLPRR